MNKKIKYFLGFQHLLAMFGGTIIVPMVIGIDPSIALLTAGLGTLCFYYISERKVPVFLGSSSLYITIMSFILHTEGLGAVKTGVIAAGIVYMIIAFIFRFLSEEKINEIFSPIVIGCLAILIGLKMAPTAIQMCGDTMQNINLTDIFVSTFVLIAFICFSFLKSFLSLISIVLAIAVGYILSMCLGLVDYSIIANAKWVGFSKDALHSIFTMPTFSLNAIVSMSLIAVITFLEHVTDVRTNGKITGQNFIKDPGIHKTLFGDGFATFISGLLGGPVKCTYDENTSVLVLTKVYNPEVIKIASIYAILLSLIGKIGAIIQTIPNSVMGGVSIILYGTSICLGIRIFIEDKIDFQEVRNIIIVSITIIFGLCVDNIPLTKNIQLSGITIAMILNIFLNLILPKKNNNIN